MTIILSPAIRLSIACLALALGQIPLVAHGQSEREQLFWDSIRCDQESEVRLYLEMYPGGAYLNEAIDCLQQIVRTEEESEQAASVSQKLSQCAAHLRANRLTTGVGGTAFECYETVLKRDPGNTQAIDGLKTIEETYVNWIRANIDDGELERARSNLTKLGNMNPEHPMLEGLADDITVAKEERIAAIVRRCEESAKLDNDYQGIQVEDLNPDIAVPACERAVEARPDDMGLQTYLCRALAKGEYFQKALDTCMGPARKGNPIAQTNLGWAYANVNQENPDYEKALKWYGKAADQGGRRAMNNIGRLYFEGYGVEQDYETALGWYRRAAKLGDVYAQVSLGWSLYNGFGVEQDYKEAIKWYRKAAEQGYARANTNLGWAYQNGRGVTKDYEEAIRLYRKAAEQGDPLAKNNLGWAYQKGLGVPRNYETAATWYEEAAEAGNSRAQLNLASLYEKGLGRAKNRNEAVRWYRQAAASGSQRAREALSRLGVE